MSMLLKTVTIGKFQLLSTYVNRVQYTVEKAILFKPSLKSALCIKYIKFSTSSVLSRAFGATK